MLKYLYRAVLHWPNKLFGNKGPTMVQPLAAQNPPEITFKLEESLFPIVGISTVLFPKVFHRQATMEQQCVLLCYLLHTVHMLKCPLEKCKRTTLRTIKNEDSNTHDSGNFFHIFRKDLCRRIS